MEGVYEFNLTYSVIFLLIWIYMTVMTAPLLPNDFIIFIGTLLCMFAYVASVALNSISLDTEKPDDRRVASIYTIAWSILYLVYIVYFVSGGGESFKTMPGYAIISLMVLFAITTALVTVNGIQLDKLE
jgi:hypothetical protein